MSAPGIFLDASISMKPRDAIHAAVMQHNRITHILSTDKHFDALNTIVRVDPVAYLAELGRNK